MNNSTHITNVNSNSTHDARSYNTQWLDVLQFTLFAVIFTVSTTGNTLVCLVVARTRRMRTTRNYLLVNLAVSDLTVALLCIPFDMVLKIAAPDWPLGAAMCKLLWPSMTLVTNSSAATLAFISYDRYRAVVRPTRPRFSTRQTGFIIGAIWVVSLLLVLPYVLALRVIDNNCTEKWPSDSTRKIYTVGLFVFQYALPLVIIAVAYVRVVRKLREQAEKMARNYEVSLKPPSPPSPRLVKDRWNFKSNRTPQMCDTLSVSSPLQEKKLFVNGNLKKKHYLGRKILAVKMRDTASPLPPRKLYARGDKEKQQTYAIGKNKEARRLEHNTKVVKMLVSVVLLYAICLLPNQAVWLWYEFGSGQSWPHINELLIFGSLMVYINSSVNPLLYAGMNEEFRKGFIGIIKCQWKEQPELI